MTGTHIAAVLQPGDKVRVKRGLLHRTTATVLTNVADHFRQAREIDLLDNRGHRFHVTCSPLDIFATIDRS